jgi:hypothetical protein
MTTASIDHHTLARLVQTNAVRGTHIVGKPGGWGVIVRHGKTESPLAATRSKQARVFKRFETLVGYLKEIGIHRFDVDAAEFDPTSANAHRRPDTSATLKQAHAALAHDKWFREQVVQAVKQADDPATAWVSNDTVMAESTKRRAAWRSRAAASKERGVAD